MKIDNEIKDLFRKVRTLVGAPIRTIQLTDEQLCDLLEICVEDYSSTVQNWLITNNWISMFGQNVNTLDLTFAITMRKQTMIKDFSAWFSKEVGLQQNGQYELKKDYFPVQVGVQEYLIPAGREINRVLFVDPPSVMPSAYAGTGGAWGAGSYGVGMDMTMLPSFGLSGGFYLYPSYDMLLTSSHLDFKRRMVNGNWTYSVTALNSGEHIIHLYSPKTGSLPYNQYNFGSVYKDCNVWYTYYDVTQGDVDECRKLNPDIILTPDQVPLTMDSYGFFNAPTKVTIRQLLVAKTKETLGIIRGTYGGKVSIPNAELNLEYQMLLQQGKDEYTETMKELKERLEKMTPWNQVKQQADMVEDMIRLKRGQPFPTPIIPI